MRSFEHWAGIELKRTDIFQQYFQTFNVDVRTTLGTLSMWKQHSLHGKVFFLYFFFFFFATSEEYTVGSLKSIDNMLMALESKVIRSVYISFRSWPLWEICHPVVSFASTILILTRIMHLFTIPHMSYLSGFKHQMQAKARLLKAFHFFSLPLRHLS